MRTRLVFLCLGLGAVLLAGCDKIGSTAKSDLAADPDFTCATALMVTGGSARSNGDKDAEAKVVNRLHFYMGRLSVLHPNEHWFASMKTSIAATAGDPQKAFSRAQECSTQMAHEFDTH